MRKLTYEELTEFFECFGLEYNVFFSANNTQVDFMLIVNDFKESEGFLFFKEWVLRNKSSEVKDCSRLGVVLLSNKLTEPSTKNAYTVYNFLEEHKEAVLVSFFEGLFEDFEKTLNGVEKEIFEHNSTLFLNLKRVVT